MTPFNLIGQRIILLLLSAALSWFLLSFIQWNGNPGTWSDPFRFIWVVIMLSVYVSLVQKGDNRFYRAQEKTVIDKKDRSVLADDI